MVDTLRLYSSGEQSFTTNGLGPLPDAISCIVREELEDVYELELEYPVSGRYFDLISRDKIIYAKPNPYDGPQPFRIVAISKPISGTVTINATHIAYDLNGWPVYATNSEGLRDSDALLAHINAHSLLSNNPFHFESDIHKTAEDVLRFPPASMRDYVNLFRQNFGGEVKYDKYTIRLVNKVGSDNGVTIKYGKNLTDLKQEEKFNGYNAVFPFLWTETAGEHTHSGSTKYFVADGGPYAFLKIFPLDLTSQAGGVIVGDTLDQFLEEEARKYMKENKFGDAEASLEVSFVDLSKSPEYENLAVLEQVNLGDTVHIQYTELGVNGSARCIATEYDVLTNTYTKVELGEAVADLSTTISAQAETAASNNAKIKNIVAEIKYQDSKIEAKVEQTGTNEQHSFSWELLEDHFQVNSNGRRVFYINQNGAEVDGKIIADSGKIADWNITEDGLTDNDVGMLSGDQYNKESLVYEGSDSEVRFFAGDGNPEEAKFIVLKDGSCYMRAADVDGNVNAGDLRASNTTVGENLTVNGETELSEAAVNVVRSNGNYIIDGDYDISTASLVVEYFASSVVDSSVTLSLTATFDNKNTWRSSLGTSVKVYLTSVRNGRRYEDVAVVNIPSNAVDQESGWTESSDDPNIFFNYLNIDFGGLDLVGISTQKGGTPSTRVNYSIESDGSSADRHDAIQYDSTLAPLYDNEHQLGTVDYKWKDIFTYHVSNASSRLYKKDISNMEEKHDKLFDALIPRTYKMINGDSGRTHYGFVLDELGNAIEESGLSSDECAAYLLSDKDNPNGGGSIRYTEFIPLLTRQIQNLKKELAELKAELNKKEKGD